MLKPLQRNKDILLLSGKKDEYDRWISVEIFDKAPYKEKINRWINDDGISQGVYFIKVNDNTLEEWKSFQNFIYRIFKKRYLWNARASACKYEYLSNYIRH